MKHFLLLFGVILITSPSLLSQSITVVQANGGEELYPCETYPITWDFSGGVSNYFDIDYSLDGGTIWASVASSYFSNTGVYNWTVPNVQSSTALFRVKDAQDGTVVDQSDNYFTIGVPINVLSPNGGEVFNGNTVETITWDAQGTTNTFNIYYSTNNGSSWSTIVSNHSTVSGTYQWNVPNISSTSCLIRVADYSQNCKQDESDAVFAINPATPVLTFPNGGEELLSSCDETITWDPSTFYSSVRLDYSIDNGSTWNVIASSTGNDGSHTWSNKPTGPLNNCLIKASNVADLSYFDVSDATFSIEQPLELTTVFEDTLYGCTNFTVDFNHAKRCESNYTYLYYSIDNGATWINFETHSNSSYGTSSSRTFNVPNGITSDECKFMVCTESNGGYCDTSNYTFTILPAPIDVEVVNLNGGEIVQPDDVIQLSWINTSGLTGLYDLYYSTNGTSFTMLENDLNSLNYNWTVPNIPTSSAKIKVKFDNQNCNFDESDAAFSIGKRTPIMTYPNGGESLLSGCEINVTWDSDTYYGNVRIDYSVDNGVVWSPVVTNTSNDGSYPWTVPSGPEGNVMIKVTQVSDLSHVDESDATFSIKPPVELTTVFEDTLYGCTNFTVDFNHAKRCESNYTYLYYSIDDGATWTNFETHSNSSYGTSSSRTFNVPNGITSDECKFMVCTETSGGYCDTSNYTFTILPAEIDVEVLSLNGGEIIQPDATVSLTWTNTSGLTGTYDIYYSTNGSSFSMIENDFNGTSYNWTVPNIPTSNGKIKVVFNNEYCNVDISDGEFTIEKRTPVFTFPNGGEEFLSGCEYTILWDQSTYYSNVRIDYSIDNGSNWNAVVTSTANDGSHSWNLPSGPLNELVFKVSEVGDLTQTDQSDAVNSISAPVELTTVFEDTLYGCTNFTVDFNHAKRCESNYTYLYYSIDDGATWINFETHSNSTYGTSSSRTFNVPNGITSDECKFMVCTETSGGYCDTANYTFTILPAPIDIDVTYPNGGETFIIGDQETITWTSSTSSSGVFDLYYSLNGGSSFTTLASNVVGNSYEWTVPNSPNTDCIIRVREDGKPCNFDVSDNVFEISPQPAVMLTPNGGEILESACSSIITWDESTYYSTVRLDYSIDNGLTWSNIVTSTTNDGSHTWTPPSGPQSLMKIRVSQSNDLTRFDVSDNVFEIKPPVELTTVFEDTLYGCTNFTVDFNHAKRCESNYTYLYYSIDDGATWINFETHSNSTYGTSSSRTFNVPNGITSDECKFMVCTETSGGYCDTANYTFTILPAPIDVEVVDLNGGETVQPDDVVQISWTNTSGLIGVYDVYYSTNGGSSYTMIENDVNGLNCNWTVPNIPTGLAKIKVKFDNQNCNFDESDATFTIGKRTPILTAPNGGEEFLSACDFDITWDDDTYYSNVRIDYSSNNGVTWNTIVTNTANDGYHSWNNVPSGLEENLLIKVSQTNDLSHFDVSDAVFTVNKPVELTTVFEDTLYGCTNFTVDFNYAKRCESNYTYLYYSIDDGATWTNFETHSNSSYGSSASRTFNVPNGITSDECKFMVCTESNGGVCDTSNYTFTILPAEIDVTVISPNGGESFAAESSALITWTNSPNTSGPYNVYYSTNGGSSWTLEESNVIGNNYNWNVPNSPSTTCKVEVRVSGQNCNRDESDNNFTITPKAPLLLTPNGGEEFYAGLSTNITWDNSTFYSNVRIEYSTDNGVSWSNITSSTSNDGSHNWTLPNENSALCLVRITQTNDVSRFDVSDNVFRIKPAVTIVTPNGDDGITNWGGCTVTSITFDRSPEWNRYNILYSIDGGINWITIENNWYSTANPSTYNWTMPNIPTSQALVRVEPYYETSYYDESDATFTITKPVTLTQPNFGGVMQVGSIYNIEWNSDGISNIYDLYYSSDNGATWNTIITGYNTSTNTYAWNVPNDVSTQCLIKVQDNIDNCKEDISDMPFTITNVAPPLTINTPNGGDTLTGCDNYLIEWSETSVYGTYDIAYSTNGGSTWNTIVNSYNTTNASYNWNVPNINASGVLVRVLVTGSVTEDLSDALFAIERNSVEISTADQTICSGNAVSLEGINGANYSWSPSTGLDDPNSATPTATPQSTTTYYVTSVVGSCISKDSVTITIENNPSIIASVAINADMPTTICENTTVTFTATPTNGGSSPVYDWMVNNISTGETSATFSTGNLNDGDEVNVEMISNLSCATGSPATSPSLTFDVTPELAPTVSITASNDTICTGEEVDFTTSVSNEGVSPSFDWKVNGVSTGLTGSNVSMTTLAHEDNVSVELTSSESCVSSTQAISNNIEISVFDVPTVPSAISGNTSICASALNNYFVVSEPDVTTYVWDIPGSWQGNSTTNQISVTPDVSGMISVEAQNQCGNSSASTLNVTVNSLPNVSANASDLSICQGDSVNLSGAGASTYTWNNGVSNNTYFTPLSTNDYIVIGTDANGCQSSDTVNVEVLDLPNINILGNIEICEGEVTNLTADGATDYIWDNNATTQTISVSPISTTGYQVSGTDANGCTSTASTIVTVQTTPSVFITGNTSVCQGDSVSLTASGALNYNWSNAFSGTSQTIISTDDTTLSVTGYTSNGCSGSSAISITMKPFTTIDITGDNTICNGENVVLTATGSDNYVWSTGETSSSIVASPGSTTIYTVTGSTSGQCSKSTDHIVNVNNSPFISASADVSICTGESTTINATGGSSYTWNNGAGSGASVNVSPNSNTTYTVTGTDTNGCTNTDEVVVSINTPPVITTSPDVAICNGSSTLLTASGASSYSWDNGAGTGSSVTVSPTSSTGYVVTGTDANGCMSTEDVIVTVDPSPVLTISGDLEVCNGNSINLNASGASDYAWSNGLGSSSSVTVSPTSTTTYTVTGTNTNGCEAITTHTVTVNPSPSVNAGTDVSICDGQSTTLTATGGNSYSWDQGLGSGNNFVVQPASTTIYNVTTTDTNGCTAVDDIQVTVNNAPIVITSSNETICSGESVDLSASGASSYSWDNGAGNGALVTVSPSNSTVYTVTGTSANGCMSTGQVVVTVDQAPALNVTGNTDLCQGESTILNASGASTYSWDNALGTNASVPVSPNTTTVYTVTGTATNGCFSSLPITVDVNSLPTVVASSDASICLNDTTDLTASGADSYVWDNGAGTGNLVSVNPTLTTTYTVTGTALNGCSATDEVIVSVNSLPNIVASGDVTICENDFTSLSASGASTYTWDNGVGAGSNVNVAPTVTTEYTVTGTDNNGCTASDLVLVTVNANPTISINGNLSICPGVSTSLTASGASTYSWSNGLGSNPVINVSPGSSTMYEVTGTDINGCTSIQQETVNVSTIDLSVSVSEITLTSLNTAATSYQWIDCDNNNVLIGGANAVSYTVISNGNYAVILTENGCTDTTDCYAIASVGIEDEKLTAMNVYPNPTSGKIKIDGAKENQVYQLFGINGKLIKEGKFKAGENQMDLTYFAPGIYILKVDEQTFKISKK